MGNDAPVTSEVAAIWHELFAQIAAKSVLAPDALPLTDYALGNFNPKLVIERLLDPTPSYFAHKEILFAGLCAWTVGPKHTFLIEEAMVLAGASRLAVVERKHQEQLPQAPILADIVTRIGGPGIDFYQDFYYPAGGLQRIIKARSPRLMQRSLQAAAREIGFAVEMMRVCHDHALRLQDRRRYRTASFVSGGQAVSELLTLGKTKGGIVNTLLGQSLPKRTVDGLNSKKKSDKFSRSAAMIYAAYSIPCEGDTLLSLLCRGEATYKKYGHLLDEWVGRAAFVAKCVISPMYVREGMAEQTEYLSAITPIEIAPPDYGEASLHVDQAFKIARQKSATVGG